MRFTARCIALLAAGSLLAVPVGAQDPGVTLPKLVAVRHLRCDALRRGKVATLSADIHRAEAARAQNPRDAVGANLEAASAAEEAGTAIKEAGRLKRRLAEMGEVYVSAQRLSWYNTVDQAHKIRIERQIIAAQEIMSGRCESGEVVTE